MGTLLIHPLISLLGCTLAFFVDGFGIPPVLLGFGLSGILRSSTRRGRWSPVGALPGLLAALLPSLTWPALLLLQPLLTLLTPPREDIWVSALFAAIAFGIFSFGAGHRRAAWWCGWLLAILVAMLVAWKVWPNIHDEPTLELAPLYTSILTAEIVEAFAFVVGSAIKKRADLR
jgi:hypothetical protein